MSGRLIYLMGPSGSGKDSLLNAARERLGERGCVIARRVITRSAEALGEDAIGVSPTEFDQQEAAGAFALSWRANGLAYGIPRQIDAWLAAGQDVLVNGSRGYLPQAREHYPGLLAILLQVAVLTASATLVVGPLSFVGLLAPHMAKLMGLVRARWHLLGAAGCGALLMVLADWVGQQILFPQEVPVGLVSTLLGGAYFMWCLRRL